MAISATKIKKQSLSAAESRTSTVKSWMKFSEKIHTCRKFIPGDTRAALEVFRVYEAEGEYFDISDPSHIVRDTILIGGAEQSMAGYEVGNECLGASSVFQSVRRNASTSPASRPSSTSTVPALRPMRGDVSERNDSQKRAVVPLF